MQFIFPVFGLAFVIIGVMAVKNPNSIMPRIKRISGSKSEEFQIQQNPAIMRVIGIVFIIFGAFFALAPFGLFF